MSRFDRGRLEVGWCGETRSDSHQSSVPTHLLQKRYYEGSSMVDQKGSLQ